VLLLLVVRVIEHGDASLAQSCCCVVGSSRGDDLGGGAPRGLRAKEGAAVLSHPHGLEHLQLLRDRLPGLLRQHHGPLLERGRGAAAGSGCGGGCTAGLLDG